MWVKQCIIGIADEGDGAKGGERRPGEEGGNAEGVVALARD